MTAHLGPAPTLVALIAAVSLALALWLARAARARAAIAGGAAVLVALIPPVEHAAEHGVAPHMAQHLLLVSVAAPLVAVAPAVRSRRLPFAVRRRLAHLARWSRGHLGAAVAAAAAAHAAAVVIWHVPGPYDAAVRSPLLHVLEHVTLLGTGVALWATVRVAHRRHPFPAVGALFVTAVIGAGVGALLTFAPEPVYTLSDAASRPLHDQQLAGVLMWVPGGLVPLAGAVAVVAAALTPALTDRPSPVRSVPGR